MTGLGLAIVGGRGAAETHTIDLSTDGTSFRARHTSGRLMSNFTAPTRGWVAVGFNNQERLEGTRFVIGAMRQDRFHVEEHIAVGPGHPRVQDLGLEGAVQDVTGAVSNDQTMIAFSLPHVFADTDNPTLLSGTSSYLMLAWSHETDFGHHSAWRRHFVTEL